MGAWNHLHANYTVTGLDCGCACSCLGVTASPSVFLQKIGAISAMVGSNNTIVCVAGRLGCCCLLAEIFVSIGLLSSNMKAGSILAVASSPNCCSISVDNHLIGKIHSRFPRVFQTGCTLAMSNSPRLLIECCKYKLARAQGWSICMLAIREQIRFGTMP